MHDDVMAKLAAASSPEEVQKCLDDCGYKLEESGEPKSEEGDAPVKDESDSKAKPPPFPPKKGGDDKLKGVVEDTMKGWGDA